MYTRGYFFWSSCLCSSAFAPVNGDIHSLTQWWFQAGPFLPVVFFPIVKDLAAIFGPAITIFVVGAGGFWSRSILVSSSFVYPFKGFFLAQQWAERLIPCAVALRPR
jgi:hypothetical protein